MEKIGAVTGRNAKIAIIKENIETPLFKEVIRAALDPYINYYIRAIPAYETSNTHKTLDWALNELSRLSNREFTGNAGIEHLSCVLSSLSRDDSTVIERIIGKDLRCGMADGIVNAVIKDFIPTYPCLLARPYDDKNIKNIKFPAYSQLKADGLRVNLHTNGSTVSICGRSGRNIDLLGVMDAEVAKLGRMWDYPVVLDGELVVVDEAGKILSRKIGNGIINKAIKGTITEDEAKMVRAQIWDVIPAGEFKSGLSKKMYKDRFEEVSSAIEKLKPTGMDATMSTLIGNSMKYWIIPSKVVNNLNEAVAHFEEMLAAGEEGTILKNFNAPWEDSRSKHLVKMKAEKDCDLEVIGWNPGTGQFEGMVGSLVCASRDQKVIVAISGFDVATRQQITNDIKSIIGKIVTITYNERIASKEKGREGVYSLFLPRFQEFRYDKTAANSIDEIK